MLTPGTGRWIQAIGRSRRRGKRGRAKRKKRRLRRQRSLIKVSNEQSSESPLGMNDHDLRTVSVTIRLSKAECVRLHQRAAEAGVTVSAYLRSCTFEAEALRAQVKAVLAELRSAAAKEKPAAPVKERRSWFRWFARLLPNWRSAMHD